MIASVFETTSSLGLGASEVDCLVEEMFVDFIVKIDSSDRRGMLTPLCWPERRGWPKPTLCEPLRV